MERTNNLHEDLRERFLRVVTKRWLKTHEIYFLLKNPDFLSKLGFKNQEFIENLPQSGNFSIWNKNTNKNKWKKDGHEWVTRKNNPNYVREDQENLKVNDEDEIIKCSYTHGKPDSNITSPTLKRRAYWLYRTKSQISSSQNQNSSILIHYLDEEVISQNKNCDQDISILQMLYNEAESIKADSSMKSSPPSSIKDRNEIVETPQIDDIESNKFEMLDDIEVDNMSVQNQSHHSISAVKSPVYEEKNTENPKQIESFFSENVRDYYPFSTSTPIKYDPPGPISSTMFYGDIHNNSTVNINLELSMIKERLDSYEKRIMNQNTNGSSNSTNQLVNRMNQLSCTDRLDALRFSYISEKHRNQSDPFSLKSILLQNVKILDFSPEWDYTSGGAKLLICFKPDLTNLIDADSGIDVYEVIENRFQIRFGEVDVPVKFIQRGVIKCHAPPNPQGYVELKMLYDGQLINEECKDNSDLFQYRENQNIKRKVCVRARDDNNTLLNNEPREFKVRLIEALSGLERDLNCHSCQGSNSSKSYKEKPSINFEQLKHLDVQILEKINRGYFIRVIRLIFNKMMNIYGKERSARIINQRDSHGLSIVHYVVCLDYFELIHDLYEIGADLSLPTLIPGKKCDDMIPIVICSAKGFENTLSEILKYVPTPYTIKEKEKRLESTSLVPNPQSQNNIHLSQGSVENHDFDSDEEIKSIEGPFEAAFNNNRHEILEILLREMTLQNALKTDDSSENGDNDLKNQNLLRSLDNIDIEHSISPSNQAKGRIKQLLYKNNNCNSRKQEEVQKRINAGNYWAVNSLNDENIDDDSYFIKNSEGYKIEVITDEMLANNLISNCDQINKRNISNGIDDNIFNNKTKIKKSCSSNAKQIDSLVENHNQNYKGIKCSKKGVNMLTNLKCCIKDLKLIQKLQRKVKNWLIKRQAKDVYHASNVLTNEMKKKCKIGINQKDAIVSIQRAFRAYLAEKAHIY